MDLSIFKTKTFWSAAIFSLTHFLATQGVIGAEVANIVESIIGVVLGYSVREAIQKSGVPKP
jgi:hypothetical protein